MKIDFSDIQALCESKTLVKGTHLAKLGAVRQLTVEGASISALVEGTQTYHVRLSLQPELHGQCTCPAAEYQPFCKHMVAVALSLDHETESADSEGDLIRRYLADMDKEMLLDKLFDYLSQDESKWKQLLAQAKLSQNTPSYQSLKKMITQALPRRDIWDWSEVSSYFIEAEQQVELVLEAAKTLDAEKQWKLMTHLVERFNSVLMEIDDSNGERSGLEALINQSMPEIFMKLSWSEQAKAQWMFDHLTTYEFDVFPSIEEDFVHVYQNNTYFLQRCREAIAHAAKTDDSSWELKRYAYPLIIQAKDWHEVAEIKQTIARCCDDYLALAQLYFDHDKPLDAQNWLLKAQSMASEREAITCQRLQVAIYLGQGDKGSAWKQMNRLFAQRPNFTTYQELCQFKASHQIDDDLLALRTEQVLLDACQRPVRRFGPNYLDSLVEFYIDCESFEKACQWVDNHSIDHHIQISLANQIIDQQPGKALDYYLQVIEFFIEQTNKAAYEQAMEYLQAFESRMPANSNMRKTFYRQVKELSEKYKRKRTMMALFKKYYGNYL